MLTIIALAIAGVDDAVLTLHRNVRKQMLAVM